MFKISYIPSVDMVKIFRKFVIFFSKFIFCIKSFTSLEGSSKKNGFGIDVKYT